MPSNTTSTSGLPPEATRKPMREKARPMSGAPGMSWSPNSVSSATTSTLGGVVALARTSTARRRLFSGCLMMMTSAPGGNERRTGRHSNRAVTAVPGDSRFWAKSVTALMVSAAAASVASAWAGRSRVARTAAGSCGEPMAASSPSMSLATWTSAEVTRSAAAGRVPPGRSATASTSSSRSGTSGPVTASIWALRAVRALRAPSWAARAISSSRRGPTARAAVRRRSASLTTALTVSRASVTNSGALLRSRPAASSRSTRLNSPNSLGSAPSRNVLASNCPVREAGVRASSRSRPPRRGSETRREPTGSG